MKLPPYADLLKLSVERDGDDQAPVLAMPFDRDVLGRPGFLHGGAIGGCSKWRRSSRFTRRSTTTMRV